ncbi:unnamed protein product [Effrenium voratum]|nr:unnamed protein product [Effrenium voratum]
MKVGGLSSATLASGEMLADSQVRGMTAVMPSMEVQAIRLKATGVLREIHWIEIADVTQPSTFRIRMTGQVGQEATMSFANSVDPGTVRDGVRDANVIIAGEEPYRLHNCRSMSVDVNETAPARRFTLTFECPLEAGTSRWIGLDLIDPGLGSATVGTLQTATAPLAGSFMVGHSGTWSSAIEARTATTSWTHLTQEVQNIRRPEGDANGQLELECFRHPQGWSSGEQFQVLVRFRRPLGNVPLLEVNTTGLRGTGFSLEVYPVEDGDADAIFLDRIPADLFEVPDPADPDVQPVRVVVNGVVGALGGNTLGYRYNTSLVPVLVSVSPSMVDANGTLSLVVGNILAYTNGVSNWTQDLMVQLGEDAGQCQDFQEVSSSGSNVEVTCVLANARAGLHAVNLISLSQGQADPSLAPEVSVEAVLDEVGPLTGSLAGGTVLTLVGVGLRGMNCSQLLVGGVPCTEPAASNIPVPGDVALACLTPALSSFDASSDPANWARTSAADVTLAQPASTASVVRASFQYASGSTPLLSDVVPSFYSSALSTTIVINGSGLASAAGASEAPVVQFGERMGSVTTQEDIGLHVWLLRAAPTPPDQDVVVPLAWIPGKGFAAVPSGVTFESRFEVTAISPVSGSKAGGILVTITGAGFHSDATKHTVKFDLSGGLSRDCAVISGTTSELTCRLQGGASMENMGPSASDSEHDHGMRRLSAERERREKLRCEAGADDHSKVRCFALAMSPGSIRSLSSDTEGGRSKDALDWIRRSELEGGQRPMVEPVYNIEDSSFEDDLISGPETADGEPARRLELEDDVDLAPARSEAFQGLRRWGVDSDEAEEFRLRRLGPARPREKEALSRCGRWAVEPEVEEDWGDDCGDESPGSRVALLYTVVSGQGVFEDENLYYETIWCDKCGDNAGMEADLYCVDCEGYFCWACSGRWHHPGGCNEMHSLEEIVTGEEKGLKLFTPLLDEIIISVALYTIVRRLIDSVDQNYLFRSDICPTIRWLQNWLAWTDTLTFYHFKEGSGEETLMASCSSEDNFWKLLLDGWVRTTVTDSDSLLLLLRTLPQALVIHYIAITFLVPPLAVCYAACLLLARALELRLPRWRWLRKASVAAQQLSALSARFVSYTQQAPQKTRPRQRPSQDVWEWWDYWSRRQVRWFNFYFRSAKECATLLLANIMRLIVIFRCLGICFGLGNLLRWMLESAGLHESIRVQQEWFGRAKEMLDTDRFIFHSFVGALGVTFELLKQADLWGFLACLFGVSALLALDVLLRFGLVRRRWLGRKNVQKAVLLPLGVVLVVVPAARWAFSLLYFGLVLVLWLLERLTQYVVEKQQERFWEQWESTYRDLTLGKCEDQCPCPCTRHPAGISRARKLPPVLWPGWSRLLRACKRRQAKRDAGKGDSQDIQS